MSLDDQSLIPYVSKISKLIMTRFKENNGREYDVFITEEEIYNLAGKNPIIKDRVIKELIDRRLLTGSWRLGKIDMYAVPEDKKEEIQLLSKP